MTGDSRGRSGYPPLMALRGARRARFRLDAESLDRLYREHAEQLLTYFARRVFDAEAAVDLVSETFAAAFEARSKFRGSTEEEAIGFLFGIARNKLLAHIHDNATRTRKSRQIPVDRRALTDAEIERIEELAGLSALHQAVREKFDLLPLEHQAALELRIVEELDYGEVAARMNISEQAARARVSRGLRALATQLTAAEDLA